MSAREGQQTRKVERPASTSAAAPRRIGDLDAAVDDAVSSARRALLDLQRPDGHWCGELEGDTILESEYALLLHFLGREDDPKLRKLAGFLRSRQQSHGGWSIYPGGPAELSASVKAYFVLKLAGDDPRSPHMERARQVIRGLGGLDACNSFTKLYLSIFGQYDWDRCPCVPPELILFPRWFPFNIYEMSAWSRTIVVPLSIVWACRPSRPVPRHAAIDELRLVDSTVAGPRFSRGSLAHHGWSLFFRLVDRAHKAMERLGWLPLRARALQRAEGWILERLEKSDGLGAIFPPIVNTIIALRGLGYPGDHPVVQAQIRELEKLEIEDSETLRVQPCRSPTWDTALSLTALGEQDEPGLRPRLQRAVDWLLACEVREPGDWRQKNPDGPIGGWYFEYANEFYPDVDDTAQILIGVSKLGRLEGELGRRWEAAAQRAIGWMLSMQNRDGGWASFDRGCDRELLTYIPFADHNAMIDPSTTDITARVVEALSQFGYDRASVALRRGVEFLYREQEADGSWYGRWGCNYLYGTWLALVALRRAGEDPADARIQAGAAWIRSRQNQDGGWGELPASYADPSLKGRGPSTAAQTAWAVLGLLAAGDPDCPSCRAGVGYLLASQRAEGFWIDEGWTGTGFPEVFYLRYHLYAAYFPLLALEVWRRRARGQGPEATAGGPRPLA